MVGRLDGPIVGLREELQDGVSVDAAEGLVVGDKETK